MTVRDKPTTLEIEAVSEFDDSAPTVVANGSVPLPVEDVDTRPLGEPKPCLVCLGPTAAELQRGILPEDHCQNGETWGWCHVRRVAWSRVD